MYEQQAQIMETHFCCSQTVKIWGVMHKHFHILIPNFSLLAFHSQNDHPRVQSTSYKSRCPKITDENRTNVAVSVVAGT